MQPCPPPHPPRLAVQRLLRAAGVGRGAGGEQLAVAEEALAAAAWGRGVEGSGAAVVEGVEVAHSSPRGPAAPLSTTVRAWQTGCEPTRTQALAHAHAQAHR